MFDHIALGIELPGPITKKQLKWQRGMKKHRDHWLRVTGHEAGNFGYGHDSLDPDFDDPPIFTLAEPELPHPPGAEQ